MSMFGIGDSFRVSVCLKQYFSDERARAYLVVNSAQRVSWLQTRVRRTFGLSGPFCLTSQGHLLPPGEPLIVLRPDDQVKVIPLKSKLDLQCLSDSTENVSTASVFEDSNHKKRKVGQNVKEKVENAYSTSPPTQPVSIFTMRTEYSEKSIMPSEPPASVSSECEMSFVTPDELQDKKLKALSLLDEYSGFIEDAGTTSQRRTRKRVRRRRPRARDPNLSLPLPDENNEQRKHLTTCSEQSTPSSEVCDPTVPESGAGVLRNGLVGPRAPRLVHTITAPLLSYTKLPDRNV